MKPLSVGVDYHPDVLKRFNRDVEEHEMTVLQDDGLYRHLRFARPSTGMGWFSIITTPGQLMVWGDHGCWAFAREQDMFAWFRGSHGYVNAHYWAERLIAVDRNGSARAFSEDQFKQWVLQDFWERRESYEPDVAAQIWADIRDSLFDDYGDTSTAEACMSVLDRFRSYDFRYVDTWDVAGSWYEWDFHMLWSMHAILAGINAYAEARAAGA